MSEELNDVVEPKEKKPRKKINVLKLSIGLLLVTVVLPSGIFAILYNTNSDFKNSVYPILNQMPAPISDMFTKGPTVEELKEKVAVVSDYYLTLDIKDSAEKLANVKNSDEKLYHDIVQGMREKSYRKTEEIIGQVQVIDLRNDTLNEIYAEIDKAKSDEIKTKVDQITSLEDYYAIKYIKENYIDSGAIKELVVLLKQIDDTRVSTWLYFMNPADQVEIMNAFDRNYKNIINSILYTLKTKDDELISKSEIYQVKDIDASFGEIGNSDVYPIEDLAVIYSKLSIAKASSLFLKSTDEEFNKSLLESIEKREKLTTDSNNIAQNLEKTINYLQEYDKKIQEIADIYGRMTVSEVVKIVEKMMINDNRLDYFKMNEVEGIEITDEKIVLDILDKMSKTKLSEIINQLDTRKATELTRKLTLQ